jgi:hypothetical protein
LDFFFAQIASGIGLLLEVDWASLFKTFYEKAKVRIACRDPRKVPTKRLYELDKKLYLISFSVEELEHNRDGPSNNDGGDDDRGEDDEGSEDIFDGLEDPNDQMETNKGQEQTPNTLSMKGNSQHKGGSKIVQLGFAEDNQEMSQAPENIASLYAVEKDDKGCDSEQLKWVDFVQNRDTYTGGQNLPEAMEMVEDDSEIVEAMEENNHHTGGSKIVQLGFVEDN